MNEIVNVVITGLIKVNEAVTPNEDGSFTVFINDALGPSGRMAAYKHALKHILGHDFDKDDAGQIELDAH